MVIWLLRLAAKIPSGTRERYHAHIRAKNFPKVFPKIFPRHVEGPPIPAIGAHPAPALAHHGSRIRTQNVW